MAERTLVMTFINNQRSRAAVTVPNVREGTARCPVFLSVILLSSIDINSKNIFPPSEPYIELHKKIL